jgi:ribosomal protein S18 acetylase RimI-like enzyme
MAEVRPAQSRDDAAVARLLYESASGRYDLFAGGRERALRLLEATVAAPGNDTSRDGVLVAVVDGHLAGAVASFPTHEGERRRRRWLGMAYRRRAPWHWAAMRRVATAGEAIPYEPRPDSLYIDGLTTEQRFRRRGVASALLEAVDDRARLLGLPVVALDTTASNTAARALYERTGFTPVKEVPASPPLPALVFYEREVEAGSST